MLTPGLGAGAQRCVCVCVIPNKSIYIMWRNQTRSFVADRDSTK